MKIILLSFGSLFLLICCTSNPNIKKVDVLSVIKTISTDTPVSYTTSNNYNKIFYLISKNDEFGQSSVLFNVLENIKNNWVKISEYDISTDNGNLEIVSDTIQRIEIDKTEYLFFIGEVSFRGTAYNGFKSNRFIFYDPKKDSLINISYSMWAGEATGKYMVGNGKLNDYKEFLNFLTPHIEGIYGKQNLDIDDIENFHLKWCSINNGIYKLVERQKLSDQWVDIKFLTFNGSFFFSHVEEYSNNQDLKSSDTYLVSAGHACPVLVYSKAKDETYVIWIPEGWPAGGAWGLRSFNIDAIKGDNIYVSDASTILEVDILKSKVRVTSKD